MVDDSVNDDDDADDDNDNDDDDNYDSYAPPFSTKQCYSSLSR